MPRYRGRTIETGAELRRTLPDDWWAQLRHDLTPDAYELYQSLRACAVNRLLPQPTITTLQHLLFNGSRRRYWAALMTLVLYHDGLVRLDPDKRNGHLLILDPDTDPNSVRNPYFDPREPDPRRDANGSPADHTERCAYEPIDQTVTESGKHIHMEEYGDETVAHRTESASVMVMQREVLTYNPLRGLRSTLSRERESGRTDTPVQGVAHTANEPALTPGHRFAAAGAKPWRREPDPPDRELEDEATCVTMQEVRPAVGEAPPPVGRILKDRIKGRRAPGDPPPVRKSEPRGEKTRNVKPAPVGWTKTILTRYREKYREYYHTNYRGDRRRDAAMVAGLSRGESAFTIAEVYALIDLHFSYDGNEYWHLRDGHSIRVFVGLDYLRTVIARENAYFIDRAAIYEKNPQSVTRYGFILPTREVETEEGSDAE